jgi:hypothetical protein
MGSQVVLPLSFSEKIMNETDQNMNPVDLRKMGGGNCAK